MLSFFLFAFFVYLFHFESSHAQVVEETGCFESLGLEYFLFEERVTGNEAAALCEERVPGSTLAKITGDAEFDALRAFMVRPGIVNFDYWIGLHDPLPFDPNNQDGPERFFWADNTQDGIEYYTSLSPWTVGQPDNDGNCVTWRAFQFWSDVSCTSSARLMCSKSCIEYIPVRQLVKGNESLPVCEATVPGGTVAKIPTIQHHRQVSEVLANDDGRFWIGLRDLPPEDPASIVSRFTWYDDTRDGIADFWGTFGEEPWFFDEPNGFLGGDCVTVRAGGDNTWADTACAQEDPEVCPPFCVEERPILCSRLISPTNSPTDAPTHAPSETPTLTPSFSPSSSPVVSPSSAPAISRDTSQPTTGDENPDANNLQNIGFIIFGGVISSLALLSLAFIVMRKFFKVRRENHPNLAYYTEKEDIEKKI